MADTKIEWAAKVWNPVTGCTPVHAGCDNCYARRIAGRHLPKHGFDDRDFSVVRCHPERLMQPLRWQEKRWYDPDDGELVRVDPLRIFVDSMGDLFHEDVPFEFIDRVFAVMALCPQHAFILLTKQPERMREYLETSVDKDGRKARQRIGLEALGFVMDAYAKDANTTFGKDCVMSCERGSEGELTHWPLPNVILGVSVCDQDTADKFIPILLQTPAARRVVSIEPMLGPVDLTRIDVKQHVLPELLRMHMRRGEQVNINNYPAVFSLNALTGANPGGDDIPPLDWVICGGETGPGARPMHPDWVRSLRDQCEAASVPFFFKQWGEWVELPTFRYTPAIGSGNRQYVAALRAYAKANRAPAVVDSREEGGWKEYEIENGCCVLDGHKGLGRVGKKAAGCMLDGREWKQFPEAHA